MSAEPLAHYDGGDISGGVAPRARLTADRVRRWTFSPAPLTRRGYDARSAEAFRVQVADELDVLASQLANLRAENQRLNDHVELHRHGVIPSARLDHIPGAREVNLLSSAQREAESIIGQAHEYARQVAEYARQQYEGYLEAAAEDARREAERTVHEHRSIAGADVDNGAAMREALRAYGHLMISHLRAAAQHLHDGSDQLSATMERITAEAVPGTTSASRPALPPQP
ncbi:cell division protein DivIVA [Micromonospora sp. NPDC049275]|uniref:cell division protein DivIVA n=1 Tax=Micromonospora sp. NPDC049275 TaxID=3364268 RepID=UPI003722DBE0